MNRQEQIIQLEKDWNENPRWEGIERSYSAQEVINLRCSVNIEYTLAKKAQKNSGISLILMSLYVPLVRLREIRQFKKCKQV